MARNTVFDWSVNADQNTDIGGVNLAENSMRASDVNNAIRMQMAQMAAWYNSPSFNGKNVTGIGNLNIAGILGASGVVASGGLAIDDKFAMKKLLGNYFITYDTLSNQAYDPATQSWNIRLGGVIRLSIDSGTALFSVDVARTNTFRMTGYNGNPAIMFAPNSYMVYDVTSSVFYKIVNGVRVDDAVVNANGYDATNDILTARQQSGWTGDVAAIENACNNISRHVVIRPEVGGLTWDRSMYIRKANQRLEFLGGRQSIPITVSGTMSGSAIIAGFPDGNSEDARGLVIRNAWIVQPGRLGYNGLGLSNRMTNGQAGIEVWRGQAVILDSCGGYGLQHGIKLYGCGGALIDKPFFYGGVWNPFRQDAQEAISHIYLADGSAAFQRQNTNVIIRDAQCYGANTLGRQARTVGANTVQSIRHCGPRYGVLMESAECVTIEGGFFGLYAEAPVAVKPSSSGCVTLRLTIDGTFLDESNDACVKTWREADNYPILDLLTITGASFNGQIMTENGIRTQASPGGLPSVRRLVVSNTSIGATLGASVRNEGTDQYDRMGGASYGYNLANNDDPLYSSGDYCGNVGAASIMFTEYGGGQNAIDTEGNTVDANGLTPNGCKWGVYGTSNRTGQAYTRIRNLAKTGGGRIGGQAATLTP